MSKSVYCRCLNKYIIESKCNCDEYPEYWKQGIGQTEYVEPQGD